MRLIIQNLVVVFWSFLLGEVLGYIGGQLEVLSVKPLTMGIVAVIVALIGVNAITLISKPAK
ncbi:membrane protein [Paucilactobacillus hokkaidonensis JCM 18461]|uniref:Membrane protein n=2 Tax=Paucilactobacillus hokkaidonensis TaxID=1193095 RepID=A0A0A1GZ03_9LACO|nr:DUF2929 family protein [Paucilactobacillus hokkaidonensis]BAP85696.1 membrane protein [Paucilactobacillus hokkaidonensis JCM 18461]